MKKFRILKCEDRIVYVWIVKCPRCGRVERCDFEKDLWIFDGRNSGLSVECKSCGFNQIIEKEDLDNSRLISREEFANELLLSIN